MTSMFSSRLSAVLLCQISYLHLFHYCQYRTASASGTTGTARQYNAICVRLSRSLLTCYSEHACAQFRCLRLCAMVRALLTLLGLACTSADLQSFSVIADPPPPFIEGGGPTRVCDNCSFSPTLGGSGIPSRDAQIFASSSVRLRISDFEAGVDALSFAPIRDGTPDYPAVDYIWDSGHGSITIAWSDLTRLRTVREMEIALHAVYFSTQSRDPTLKGMRALRSIALDATIGSITAWPPYFVNIPIVGRNDAPLCSLRSADGAPTSSSLATFYEGGQSRALLFSAAAALHLTDVDDTIGTSAEVFFAAPSNGIQRFRATADALWSWADASEADPSGGMIAVSSFNATTGVLRLHGNAPWSAYEAVLNTVGYVNLEGSAPTRGTRAVGVRVWDASASQSPPAWLSCAVTAFTFVDVTPVNDAPVLRWRDAADETVAFEQRRISYASGDIGATLFSPLNISDADDALLTSARIEIVEGCVANEDVLAWARTSGSGLRSVILPCVLTLEGSASPVTFAAALERVTFSRTAESANIGMRIINVTIRDAAVGGALPPSARLSSAPLSVALRVTRQNVPPTLSSIGPMWVLDGDAAGTFVHNGALLATDTFDAYASFFFIVVSPAAFEVDSALGILRVAAGGAYRSALGDFVAVTVSLRDRPLNDPSGLETLRTFNVSILNPLQAPLLIGSSACIAISSSEGVEGAKSFLEHGVVSHACVDVGSKFAAQGALLDYVVFGLEGEGAGDLSLKIVQKTFGTGTGPFVCVGGLPLAPSIPANASFRFSISPTSAVQPTTLDLVIMAFPAALRGSPEERVALGVNATWQLPVQVPGCREAAAAYVPCFRKGVRLENADALRELLFTALRVDGPVCDNMCWDGDGDGICENACVLNASAPFGCNNAPLDGFPMTTSAAANPGGNFDAFATVDAVPPAAACVRPPRTAYARVSALDPARIAAFKALNGYGTSASQTDATLDVPAQAIYNAALSDGTLSNASNADAALAYAVLQLRVSLPPWSAPSLPPGISLDSPADYALAGAAMLALPFGALDAAIFDAFQAGLFSGAVHKALNVSVTVGLSRVAWPADVPVPPLITNGPAPIIDMRSLVSLSPADFRFPPATAAELCLWTGAAPSAAAAAAWALDPASRRVPIILAARSAVPGDVFGARSTAAAADAFPLGGFSPWEVVPLSRMVNGNGAPGSAAEGSMGRPPTSGASKLCARFRRLPSIVAVAWVLVEGSGEWFQVTDINNDVGASSSPESLTTVGGRLYFSATSGATRTGRELWSVNSVPVGGGAAAEGAAPASVVAALALRGPPLSADNGAPILARPGGLVFSAVDVPATPAGGASLVADLFAPGSPGADSSPADLTAYAGRLYFSAQSAANGRELFVYDPRETEVTDLSIGGLYTSDAFLSSTPPFAYSSARQRRLSAHRAKMTAQSHMRRTLALSESDILVGPTILSDIWPGTTSSNPTSLVVADGALFFIASAPGVAVGEPAHREIWVFEDTRGTTRVPSPPKSLSSTRAHRPLYASLGGYTEPSNPCACGPNVGWPSGTSQPLSGLSREALFFTARSPEAGLELWRIARVGILYDAGFPSSYWNVSLVADIMPGMSSSNPSSFACIRGVLFFTAETASEGREAWAFDTSTGAVALLGDTLVPGPDSSFLPGLVPSWTALSSSDTGIGTPGSLTVFFVANTLTAGVELCAIENWSVGSWPPPAPVLFADVFPGLNAAMEPRSSWPTGLVVYAGSLWFAANQPGVGRELAILRSLSRIVELAANIDTIGDVALGVAADANYIATHSGPTPLVAGDVASFTSAAADGSSNPTSLVSHDDGLWFAADDGVHGRELFVIRAPHAPLAQSLEGACELFARSSGAIVTTLGSEACAMRVVASDSVPGDAFGSAVALDRGTRFLSADSSVASALAGVSDGLADGVRDTLRAAGSSFSAGDAQTASSYVGEASPAAPGMRLDDGVVLGRDGGSTLVVGAPGARLGAGAAYAFEPSRGAWRQAGILLDPAGSAADVNAGTLGDSFGAAVAVDGPIIVVGAPRARAGVGSVFAFRRKRRAEASGWEWISEGALATPTASGAIALGACVSVFGGVVVAGAPGGGAGSGAAYVWTRDARTSVWGLPAALSPLSPTGTPLLGAAPFFGSAVSATLGALFVGAQNDAAVGGAVLVFTYSDAARAWVASQNVIRAPASAVWRDGAITADADARFGASVAAHGPLVAVGATNVYAPGAGAGAGPRGGAFLFARSGGVDFVWEPVGGALAADAAALSGRGAGAAAGDSPLGAGRTSGFAGAVAVSAGATVTMLVGAPGARGGSPAGGHGAGSALVFESSGGDAVRGRTPGAALSLSGATLAPRGSVADDAFGAAVAIADGVGAFGSPGAGTGVVWITACRILTSACAASRGSFVSRACSPAHDGACGACDAGPCPDGSYESAPCSGGANRVCTPCTPDAVPCGVGLVVIAPCSPAADRVCGLQSPDSATREMRDDAGVDERVCARENTCSSARVALGMNSRLAPFAEVRIRFDAPLPGDSGASWRARAALSAAFIASGGERTWAQEVASVWAAGSAHGGPPPCSWPGVECDDEGFVVGIDLAGVGLRGCVAVWLDAVAFPRLRRLNVNANAGLAAWCSTSGCATDIATLPRTLTRVHAAATALDSPPPELDGVDIEYSL